MERLHFGLKFILAFMVVLMLSLGMAFQVSSLGYVKAEEIEEVENNAEGGELRLSQM